MNKVNIYYTHTTPTFIHRSHKIITLQHVHIYFGLISMKYASETLNIYNFLLSFIQIFFVHGNFIPQYSFFLHGIFLSQTKQNKWKRMKTKVI